MSNLPRFPNQHASSTGSAPVELSEEPPSSSSGERTRFEDDGLLGMALLGSDGRLLSANPALCAMVGLTQEEVLATTLDAITHPEDTFREAALIHQLFAGERDMYEMEKRLMKPSGEATRVHQQVWRLRSRPGRAMFMFTAEAKYSLRRLTAAAPPSATPDPAVAFGRPNLLIIDDHPLVAESLRRLLSLDCDVLVASSGRAALDLLGAGVRVDLILCDLMMPFMTGMEFHAEVARRFPDQLEKIVFLTGGAYTAESHAFLDDPRRAWLEKPVDIAALREVIRRTHSRRSEPGGHGGGAG